MKRNEFIIIFFMLILLCSCHSYRDSSTNFGNLKEMCSYKISQSGKKDIVVLKNDEPQNGQLSFDKKASTKYALYVEENIISKYGKYYNSYYKQFFFIKNPKNNDTIVLVWSLNDKEVRLNPNWICEQAEIGKSYFRNSNPKHPNMFYFNLTKKEFSSSDSIFN